MRSHWMWLGLICGAAHAQGVPYQYSASHGLYNAIGSSALSGTGDVSIYSGSASGSQMIDPTTIGSRFHLRARGLVTTGALSITSLTQKITLGGTLLASAISSALPVSTSNMPYTLDAECKVTAVGASGSIYCGGSFVMNNNGTLISTGMRGITSMSLTGPLKLDSTVAFTSLIGTPTMTIDDAIIAQDD